MYYRLLPDAQAELDGIWVYIATVSGSVQIATRHVEKIENCFWLLTGNPKAGRRRDHDLGANVRSIPAGDYIVIYSIEDHGPLILHVARGCRDLKALIIN